MAIGEAVREARSGADAMAELRPAAVVFDMDGLLFDSETLSRAAMFAAAEELGHAFTSADFLQLVGRPWSINRPWLQALFGPAADIDLFKTTFHRFFDEDRHKLDLKAGVVELLDELRRLRIPTAICTSSSHDDVALNLALHDLGERFDAVIAAGDYERGKPAPDPFLCAAAKLGVPAGACVALEDSHNGVRAAHAAGMLTIMVPDLLPATDEIRALCLRVVRDLHEVRDLVARGAAAR